MLDPGDVTWPVADSRCHTCMHPLCPWIGEQLLGGTPPPMVRRMIKGRGLEPPSTHSIRSHRKHMHAGQAASRRVRDITPLLAVAEFVSCMTTPTSSGKLLRGGETHTLFAHYCMWAQDLGYKAVTRPEFIIQLRGLGLKRVRDGDREGFAGVTIRSGLAY